MADERAEIEALVRRVVMRTLGAGDTPGAPDTGRKRPLLDEAAVRETPSGATLTLAPNTINTPSNKQLMVFCFWLTPVNNTNCRII